MERHAVHSSSILSIGYKLELLTLEIEFVKGTVYQYYDVPENIYYALMSADSIGTFFNVQIKDNYPFSRI